MASEICYSVSVSSIVRRTVCAGIEWQIYTRSSDGRRWIGRRQKEEKRWMSNSSLSSTAFSIFCCRALTLFHFSTFSIIDTWRNGSEIFDRQTVYLKKGRNAIGAFGQWVRAVREKREKEKCSDSVEVARMVRTHRHRNEREVKEKLRNDTKGDVTKGSHQIKEEVQIKELPASLDSHFFSLSSLSRLWHCHSRSILPPFLPVATAPLPGAKDRFFGQKSAPTVNWFKYCYVQLQLLANIGEGRYIKSYIGTQRGSESQAEIPAGGNDFLLRWGMIVLESVCAFGKKMFPSLSCTFIASLPHKI